MKTKTTTTINGVTGRDNYIVAKALCYGIAAIERLPDCWQEASDRSDMIALLAQTGDTGVFFLAGVRAHLAMVPFELAEGLKAAGDTIETEMLERSQDAGRAIRHPFDERLADVAEQELTGMFAGSQGSLDGAGAGKRSRSPSSRRLALVVQP